MNPKSNKLTNISAFCLLLALAVHGLYLTQVKPRSMLTRLSFGPDQVLGDYPGCDFRALYFPARNLIKGRPLFAHPPKDEFRPYSAYRYAPIGVLLGLPFASFSPETAFRLWLSFIVLLLGINLFLLYKISPDDKFFGLGALLLFGSYRVFLELFAGQFSALQATFIFAALVALHLQKERAFTFSWAASLCWKLQTWITFPALAIKGKWKPLVAAAILLFATSLPVYLKYPEAAVSFFKLNFYGQGATITPANLSMGAFLAGFFKGADPEHLILAAAVCIGLVSLAITIIYRKAPLIELICLWLATYFVVYRHVWENHYLMLIPAILILALRHPSRLWLIPGLLIFLPTPYVFIGTWDFPHRIFYHGFGLLPGLITYILIIRILVLTRSVSENPKARF